MGRCEDLLTGSLGASLKGRVQLIFTSPPFPLNRKKKYGNYTGEKYEAWLAGLSTLFSDLLRPRGSIVIEMGNAWIPGRPVQSPLALRALLRFLETPEAGLRLCQEFVCFNKARLPTPAQWVTVERIRVKDAFTRVWWMAKCDKPKASNRRVLQSYSPAMRKLLKRGAYNAGTRPSEHVIKPTSFLKDHGGSIPPNVIIVSNTNATDPYQTFCRLTKVRFHPARMPVRLAEFFISFLTQKGDLVLDPFAGSNTTGSVAAKLRRRWVSIEADPVYAAASVARFDRNKAQRLVQSAERNGNRTTP